MKPLGISSFKQLKDNLNKKVIITLISFFSFLMLAKPYLSIGMFLASALVGSCVIVLKEVSLKINKQLYFAVPITVACLWKFCCRFYVRGQESESLQRILSKIPIHDEIILIAASICLAIIASYSVMCFFQGACNMVVYVNKRYSCGCFLTRSIFVSVITIVFSQLMFVRDPLSMGNINFTFNVLCIFGGSLMFFCCSGSNRISILFVSSLTMIISITDVYLLKLRSRLFEPLDIFSMGTAANVMNSYSLFPIPCELLWCFVYILALILIFKSCTGKRFELKCKQRLVIFSCCTVFVLIMLGYALRIMPNYWREEGIKYRGIMLDFFTKLIDVYVAEPKLYSRERIDEIAEKYVQVSGHYRKKTNKPHIIVIMNEAFSDLNVVGKLSTNQEVAPYIASLKENVVSGNVLVSVYGGNTANSEYEFLTGNTMAWLSPSAVPYQQYITGASYSMVSDLTLNHGYYCIAMHPYLADGWNRPAAYSHLGFKEFLALDDFPQKQLIRWYISDQEMFEGVVETFEKHKQDPLFIFGVSMQNHGGYFEKHENFEGAISLIGYKQDYPDVEQYLSLLHETDKAVKYLLTYFSKIDEDVIIVFFGDHLPALNKTFYSELSNNAPDTLEERQKRYKVPFFIWANFDIGTKSVECTSLNYLSSYVYDVAGIPQPPYNRFLKDLEKVIPAMNVHGFYSAKSQCFLPFDEASEEERIWLENYKCLQYNAVFDEKYRHKAFFPTLE